MRAPAAPKRRIDAKFARFRMRIGRSAMHRYGVFALEDIPAGRRVIEYTGKRLSVLQALKIWPPNDTFIVGVNSRRCLDGGAGGSGAQFINHSCRPNLIW